MYSNDRGFSFRELFIKIIFLAIFALLMVWLFRNYTPNMKPFYSNQFRENISYMQEAAKGYFTTDKLPTEIGKSTRLTLKQMQELKLILPFVDKDGNACNLYESFAEVTKEEKGYSLKTSLSCNTESDYVVEILGCYDYGCDKGCEIKETALEYQFSKTFSKKVTNKSCPSGYKMDGNYCYKNVGTETIAATKNYTDSYVMAVGALFTTGKQKEIEVNTVCKTVSVQSKDWKSAVKTESTSGSCKDVTIKDPNCNVQCETKYVDGEYIPVCNTCGYVTRQDCSDVKTTTNYTCPNGYDDGYTGSGADKKCYKLTTSSNTTCTCPSEADRSTGKNETLKCFKYVKGEKVAYCENKDAKLDVNTNKCLLTKGSEFSHYTCSGDYTLNKENGTCTKTKTDKVKVTTKTSTKTWTETKWSRNKTMLGWTSTGKTRIVEID